MNILAKALEIKTLLEARGMLPLDEKSEAKAERGSGGFGSTGV